jgi:predicted amidohydrolase YtcJ
MSIRFGQELLLLINKLLQYIFKREPWFPFFMLSRYTFAFEKSLLLILNLSFMKNILSLVVLILFCSCKNDSRKKADLIVYNANIYTMDGYSKTPNQSMAIKDGKILTILTNDDMLRYYKADTMVNMQGKFIYPGLIDAHSHFYGLGQSLVTVDLRGLKSEEDMIQKVKNFYSVENTSAKNQPTSIIGRGWDQNLWTSKKFPTNAKLNFLFPDVPVCLTRIDGHAALVNQKALDLAGINENSTISGGEFIKENGKLTGVLIDNAVDLVTAKLPKPSKDERKAAILKAQDICFKYGLTTVCDAGIDKDLIDLYNEMHQSDELKIRIYAMANPTQPTLNWLLRNGELKTEKLHVNSVKYYMDGAMGSRGACLIEDYADKPGHKGFLLNPIDSLKILAIKIRDKNLQLNVHCIGDSANRITLQIMAEILDVRYESRWRIEHMQLITKKEFGILEKYHIIPSMQPTHATSDAPWVTERLGKERMKYAYALQTCLQKSGTIALGTDFPVEEVNPMYTFYTAITRKHPLTNLSFNLVLDEKLSRYQALQGMTIWAAYAQFEEKEKGSLEIGKYADFIVFDKDLFTVKGDEIPGMIPQQVYVNGKLVAGKR